MKVFKKVEYMKGGRLSGLRTGGSVIILVSMAFVMVLTVLPVQATDHPSLLFTDISEVYGYQHRSEDPWKSYESSVVTQGNTALGFDFSGDIGTYNRIGYRAGYARDLALSYQLTGDPRYLEKGKEALLNLDCGDTSYKMDRSNAVLGFSLAYDWIQPYLTSSEDVAIRDKLAVLADQVYYDLNEGETNRNYVTFADYHGQAYPAMGVVGCALGDYTNPNNLPLSSGPTDWVRVGTTDLFVEDTMHDYPGRSLYSFGFDEVSGKHLNGAYKDYVIEYYVWWANIYSSCFGRNMLEEYPAVHHALTTELWETMPNSYQNNYVTNGNTKWDYQKGILNLLSFEERANTLYYLEQLSATGSLLPKSRNLGTLSSSLLYLTYNDYPSTTRAPPSWTSKLNEGGVFHTFREGWDQDSDWLSYITFNVDSGSNRDAAHHDQMSLEFYSKGDLLLADAGEDKYMLDQYYGPYEIHHNTIAIENPRTPFTIAGWSNSRMRGIYKGDANAIRTPVTIRNSIQTQAMEWLQTETTINHLIANTWSSPQSLSSPIQYTRTILYPEKEHFIIIDRLEGSEPWVFRNIFRPTSLCITPTTDTAVGNVQGDLSIGGTSFNWLSLPYKTETNIGRTTNSFTWTTTNPYGNEVNLNVFSAPSSDVLVTKHVGRIAGYDKASEVYNPVVYFKSQPTTSLYRITALLSRYPSEMGKQPEELSVSGTGTAVKILGSGFTEYIYAGNGPSSFGSFGTDADILYLRQKSDGTTVYSLLQGSYLNKNAGICISASTPLEYALVREESDKISVQVKGTSSTDMTISRLSHPVAKVTRDGALFTGWSMLTNSTLKISSDVSEHEFIIELSPGQMINQDSGIGIFRPSAQQNWILDCDMDGTIDQRDRFGTSGDSPVMGDFNHDGFCDRAVFRNGQWIFDLYRDGSADFRNNYGIKEDIPVAGDFNNDGTCDRAVFRNGQWIIDHSMDGTVDARSGYGCTGDIPLVGDFNNDGTCDRAVFRNGQWIIDHSMDGTVDARSSYGCIGDIPLAGDFNNDGTCDRAVFRNGQWIIDHSMDGTVDARSSYGCAGDIPLVWKR